MSPVYLTAPDLALAAGSLLIGAAASAALSLNLSRSLLIAVVRMCAQLLLVGLFLRHVFAIASLPLTLLVAGLMLLAAAFEVSSRQGAGMNRWLRFGIGGFSVTIATVFVFGMAMATALQQAEWHDARHMIPLLGIILGTAMNSSSLALNAMLSGIRRERAAIEARLSLGTSRYLALREMRARAARTGMIPVINQMAGAGIITLPGIMTGQILAGMDPLDAAKYQMLLLLLLAGAGLIGVILASHLAVLALTDNRDRLRLDRLDARPGTR